MAFSVHHAGLGIDLNLTEPDLGHPELPGLWELLRVDHRPVPERQLQCIQCRTARPDCPEWMFLTERDGRRFASHYTRGIADHPSNESDQHKAFKERIARAAELGGLAAELEDRSDSGKRRTDVLVKGDKHAIGWEVQLSYASLESVRKRAQTARVDGITPMWGTVDPTRDFINKVPWTLMPDMPWQEVKNGRELLVRGGVRRLASQRCDWGSPLPCPNGRNRCGRLHLRWTSEEGIQLDDLVRSSAAGEHVPVIIKGERVTNRWWVRAIDRDRFAESGGHLLTEDEAKQRRAVPSADANPRPLETECRYGQDSGYRSAPAPIRDGGDVVVTVAAPVRISAPPRPQIHKGLCSVPITSLPLPCAAPARLYACGWRCDDHKPRRP